MPTKLEIGFLLDRFWHFLRGEMETSKRPALVTLAQVLDQNGVAYAIIGGVALQVHVSEPRTTLDINVAVIDRTQIPRDGLLAAGFQRKGEHPHSENWIGPESVPVQFTDDAALQGAIARAETRTVGQLKIRVIAKADLLHEKLRAGQDPARRRPKRLQDLADAQALIESDRSLETGLTAEERAVLDRLP